MRREHLSGGTCSTGAMVTGTRSNALWGKGRRRYPLLVFAFVVVAASVVAGSTAAGPPAQSSGVVPDSLRDKAKAHPRRRVPRRHPDDRWLTARRSRRHGGRGAEEASRQCEGPDEEVQADRQRDGGGHRRPDRRHRCGEGRRQRDRGRADPGDRLRQPAELARERRRPVGRPAEKDRVPHDRDRRLGRRVARRLRQAAHPPGRPHDHGHELLGRRLRARDARRRPRRRRCRPLHGRRAAREHPVARRPRRRRQRDGEQPTGRLRLDPPEQGQVQHRCRQLLVERIERRGSAERSARQGGREAVAERRGGRRGCGELRDRRGRERRRVRARERPVRDHGRRLRHEWTP